MPVVNKYIDASTFQTATSVYDDATLSTKAADGLYQQNGVYREQVSGLLGPVIDCPFCNTSECGTSPSLGWRTTRSGYYPITAGVGTGTGAIRVVLTPQNIPNGLEVIYNGTTYTGVSSSNFGYLPNKYYGRTSTATTYNFPNLSPYVMATQEWSGTVSANRGESFVPTGASISETIVAGDLSLTATSPGNCVLFLPKTTAEPSTIEYRVYAPIGGDNDSFDISNECPTALTGFQISSPRANAADACAEPFINTRFNGPVTGSAGVPGLYDFMFADANAVVTLASVAGTGFFHYDDGSPNGAYFELDSNSVIVSIGTCPP